LFSPENPVAPPIEVLRKAIQDGKLIALGEVVSQYNGISPSDSVMEPYLSLAEELDVPIGIHIGPGPPGAPYIAAPNYRSRLSRCYSSRRPLRGTRNCASGPVMPAGPWLRTR